jgi:hypothetical protein
MLPRCVTTPAEPIATRGPTVRSYQVTNPNGGKLNTAGTSRRRFDWLQTRDSCQQPRCTSSAKGTERLIAPRIRLSFLISRESARNGRGPQLADAPPRVPHAARTRGSRAPRYRSHARGILLSAHVSRYHRSRSIMAASSAMRSGEGRVVSRRARGSRGRRQQSTIRHRSDCTRRD